MGKKNIFEVDFLIFQNESNNDAYVQPIVEGRCSFSLVIETTLMIKYLVCSDSMILN